MRTIEKKIYRNFFELVVSGEKNFDIRLNDFDCNEGDILYLREWDPIKKEFTGRFIKKRIIYLTTSDKQNHWSKQEIEERGLLIIGMGDTIEFNL